MLEKLRELKTGSYLIKLLVIISLIVSVFMFACSEEETLDLLDRLSALPGVTVTEIQPYHGYARAFQIDFQQPVDHNNPDGQQFQQRIYLSHGDESAPMVFAPSGYGVTERSGQELAGILQGNCLNVSHRYFTTSRPDPVDWQYLTVQQAATDHHRIVEIFKTIYTGTWVSAGASKSGMTPLFHKRYYPDDVEAVVAYVSPFMFSMSDQRYVSYLASIGDQETWDRLHAFQRQCFENQDELKQMLSDWFVENEYLFTRNLDREFELLIGDYLFVYWQYNSYFSSAIPSDDASVEVLFNHLNDVVGFSNSSDSRFDYFLPYYVQVLLQLGYPAIDYSHLSELLVYDLTSWDDLLQGYDLDLVYESASMWDIYNWIQTEGNNLIFIYGSIDPWTAGAVELTGQTNALKYIHPGGDHGVRIGDLAESQLLLDTLGQWLGITISQVQQRGINVTEDASRERLRLGR